MNVKISHTKFPTPERKGLFMEGFPTLKWLQEAFAQDEPFDYILTRYFNFLFFFFITFQDSFLSLLPSSPKHILCILFLDFFITFGIKSLNGNLPVLMALLQIELWKEEFIFGLMILINSFYVKGSGGPFLAQYLFRNGSCK